MRARRVFVCADSMRRRPGTRKAPPGSDKRRLHCGWPGGSGRTSLSFPALRRNCACPRGSVVRICPRFTSGAAVLLRGLTFGSRLSSRFYRRVCLRFTPVFFPLSGKKRRLAVSCVSIPPGQDRLRAFSRRRRGYLPWRVHFGFGRFFMAISTGLPGCGDTGTGNGAGGAAFVRFCAAALAL